MMKRATLVCLLTLALGVSLASAAEKSKAQSASTKSKAATRAKYPASVPLNGAITDGPNQLVIITDVSMQRRGQTTLSQVLGRTGARR